MDPKKAAEALSKARKELEEAWCCVTASDAEPCPRCHQPAPRLSSNQHRPVRCLGCLRVYIAQALDAAREELGRAASDGEACQLVADRALELAAKAVYWLPAEVVPSSADGLIAEMKSWGVPDAYLADPLEGWRKQAHRHMHDASAEQAARYALETLRSEYDYWDWYTDWYVDHVLRPMLWILALLALVGLSVAYVLSFHARIHLPAYFSAAVGGAATSILLRQPPLVGYGQNVRAWIWNAGRFVTGIAASGMGLAVLMSGLLSLPAPNGVEEAPAHLADAVSQCIGPGNPCSVATRAILLALGFLFGFSERALTATLSSLEAQFGARPKADAKSADQ